MEVSAVNQYVQCDGTRLRSGAFFVEMAQKSRQSSLLGIRCIL